MRIDLQKLLPYILLAYSALVFIYLAVHFAVNSPTYLTHSQFGTAMSALGTAVFSGFIALWKKVSLVSQDIGRIEGRIIELSKHL